MDRNASLIDELEQVSSEGDLSRRAKILRRVTDLFLLGSGSFTRAQVELFGEVMSKLIVNIEASARAAFGSRMAALPDAPPRLIRDLAFDDSIDVAGPVLRNSPVLDEAALVENAAIGSQAHLLAISSRRSLSEIVTDVLIGRGEPAVVVNTAGNPGASFSESGLAALVRQSGDDGDLALCIWSRSDIPRRHLLRLFDEASDATRKMFELNDPRKAELINSVLTEAVDRVQSKARAGSREYSDASAHVRSLQAAGKLDAAQLLALVKEGDFDRIAGALSIMCDVPVGLAERALFQTGSEQILILAKAIGLPWEAAEALLLVRADATDGSRERLDRCLASYSRLQPKTAQTALQFYRLREKASRLEKPAKA
jgi:uncharacterized protein (DUF2336 family)